MKKSNVSENDNQSKLNSLYEQIIEHNKKYHQDNNPSISDAEYDELVREAIEIEKEFPELKQTNSPTDLVGSEPLEGFAKIQHKIPMLSIQNAKIEPSLTTLAVGQRVQFQRLGYYTLDTDATPSNLVFNKIVGLRDTWAKKQ